MTNKKLDKLLQKLYRSIYSALDQFCPLTSGHRRDLNQTWYTEWMQALRSRVERHYQQQRRSPTPRNVELFRASQARYKKECRRRKRRSWRQHMEWTPNPAMASRLMKSLQHTTRPDLSTLIHPDGRSIAPGEETAHLLLDSHFPHSTRMTYPRYVHNHHPVTEVEGRNCDIVSDDLVRQAFSEFQSKRTPGPDGLKPIVLMHLPPNIIRLKNIV